MPAILVIVNSKIANWICIMVLRENNVEARSYMH